MRLFAAIDLPKDVKKQLNKICYGLPHVNWVFLEQMHITLRFIGDVDYSKGEQIKAALSKVSFRPFEIELKGVGRFPETGAANVLWAGVEAPDALEKLANDVDKAVTSVGIKRADYPFTPHITLARLKVSPAADKLRGYFNRHAEFYVEPFKISQFALYSSILLPQGAQYTEEAVYRGK